jgi:hypothetical protein
VIRLEVQDARDGIQINRPVDVGEQLVGFVRARFIPDLGLDPVRIEDQQDESVLARVESLCHRNDLRWSRAMDEALGRETGNRVETVALGISPILFVSDVKN